MQSQVEILLGYVCDMVHKWYVRRANALCTAPLSLDSEPSLSDLMDRVVSIPEQHSSTTGVHLHAVSPGVSPVTGDPSDEYTLIESDATIEQSSTSTSTCKYMELLYTCFFVTLIATNRNQTSHQTLIIPFYPLHCAAKTH